MSYIYFQVIRHDAHGMPLYAESTHMTRQEAEDAAAQLRIDLQDTFTVVRKTLG